MLSWAILNDLSACLTVATALKESHGDDDEYMVRTRPARPTSGRGSDVINHQSTRVKRFWGCETTLSDMTLKQTSIHLIRTEILTPHKMRVKVFICAYADEHRVHVGRGSPCRLRSENRSMTGSLTTQWHEVLNVCQDRKWYPMVSGGSVMYRRWVHQPKRGPEHKGYVHLVGSVIACSLFLSCDEATPYDPGSNVFANPDASIGSNSPAGHGFNADSQVQAHTDEVDASAYPIQLDMLAEPAEGGHEDGCLHADGGCDARTAAATMP